MPIEDLYETAGHSLDGNDLPQLLNLLINIVGQMINVSIRAMEEVAFP